MTANDDMVSEDRPVHRLGRSIAERVQPHAHVPGLRRGVGTLGPAMRQFGHFLATSIATRAAHGGTVTGSPVNGMTTAPPEYWMATAGVDGEAVPATGDPNLDRIRAQLHHRRSRTSAVRPRRGLPMVSSRAGTTAAGAHTAPGSAAGSFGYQPVRMPVDAAAAHTKAHNRTNDPALGRAPRSAADLRSQLWPNRTPTGQVSRSEPTGDAGGRFAGPGPAPTTRPSPGRAMTYWSDRAPRTASPDDAAPTGTSPPPVPDQEVSDTFWSPRRATHAPQSDDVGTDPPPTGTAQQLAPARAGGPPAVPASSRTSSRSPDDPDPAASPTPPSPSAATPTTGRPEGDSTSNVSSAVDLSAVGPSGDPSVSVSVSTATPAPADGRSEGSGRGDDPWSGGDVRELRPTVGFGRPLMHRRPAVDHGPEVDAWTRTVPGRPTELGRTSLPVALRPSGFRSRLELGAARHVLAAAAADPSRPVPVTGSRVGATSTTVVEGDRSPQPVARPMSDRLDTAVDRSTSPAGDQPASRAVPGARPASPEATSAPPGSVAVPRVPPVSAERTRSEVAPGAVRGARPASPEPTSVAAATAQPDVTLADATPPTSQPSAAQPPAVRQSAAQPMTSPSVTTSVPIAPGRGASAFPVSSLAYDRLVRGVDGPEAIATFPTRSMSRPWAELAPTAGPGTVVPGRSHDRPDGLSSGRRRPSRHVGPSASREGSRSPSPGAGAPAPSGPGGPTSLGHRHLSPRRIIRPTVTDNRGPAEDSGVGSPVGFGASIAPPSTPATTSDSPDLTGTRRVDESTAVGGAAGVQFVGRPGTTDRPGPPVVAGRSLAPSGRADSVTDRPVPPGAVDAEALARRLTATSSASSVRATAPTQPIGTGTLAVGGVTAILGVRGAAGALAERLAPLNSSSSSPGGPVATAGAGGPGRANTPAAGTPTPPPPPRPTPLSVTSGGPTVIRRKLEDSPDRQGRDDPSGPGRLSAADIDEIVHAVERRVLAQLDRRGLRGGR